MQNNTRIVFRKIDFQRLYGYLFRTHSLESYAIGLYKESWYKNSCKMLVQAIRIPKDSDYESRSSGFVSLKPEFMESSHRMCEYYNLNLLDIHTHPWSEQVNFSQIDDREAMDTKIPYLIKYVPGVSIAFIVFGKSFEHVSARYWDKTEKELSPIENLIII